MKEKIPSDCSSNLLNTYYVPGAGPWRSRNLPLLSPGHAFQNLSFQRKAQCEIGLSGFVSALPLSSCMPTGGQFTQALHYPTANVRQGTFGQAPVWCWLKCLAHGKLSACVAPIPTPPLRPWHQPSCQAILRLCGTRDHYLSWAPGLQKGHQVR